MTLDTVNWISILGGAIGAIIIAIASLTGAWLAMKNQKRTRHDPLKAEAYALLLSRTREVLDGPPGAPEKLTAYLEAYYKVRILSTRRVAEAADTLYQVVSDHVAGQEAAPGVGELVIEEFIAEAQTELGVDGERASVFLLPNHNHVANAHR